MRLLIRWVIAALALIVTARIVPGIEIRNDNGWIAVFVVAALAWRLFRLPNAWGTKPTWGLPLYAAATSAIIAYRFLGAPAHMGDRPKHGPGQSSG